LQRSSRIRQQAHIGDRANVEDIEGSDADRLGNDDVYFDVKWSRWLAETIPGTRRRIEFKVPGSSSRGTMGGFSTGS